LTTIFSQKTQKYDRESPEENIYSPKGGIRKFSKKFGVEKVRRGENSAIKHKSPEADFRSAVLKKSFKEKIVSSFCS
jgi:hypothetical protein